MSNETFFARRTAAGVTSVALADFAGCSRKLMLDVEIGKEPVQSWMVSALAAMTS